jgi:hypothetical protein
VSVVLVVDPEPVRGTDDCCLIFELDSCFLLDGTDLADEVDLELNSRDCDLTCVIPTLDLAGDEEDSFAFFVARDFSLTVLISSSSSLSLSASAAKLSRGDADGFEAETFAKRVGRTNGELARLILPMLL